MKPSRSLWVSNVIQITAQGSTFSSKTFLRDLFQYGHERLVQIKSLD